MVFSRFNAGHATGWVGVLLIGFVFIAGCGGDEHSDPPLVAAAIAPASLAEDTSVAGRLDVTYGGDQPVQFQAIVLPKHGSLTLDSATGDYRYTPDPDYFGPDLFRYLATAGNHRSLSAVVQFDVTPVDDVPAFEALADLQSSPERWEVSFSAQVVDVDGDAIDFAASSDNEAIATVSIDPSSGVAQIQPLAAGVVKITVTATDGHTPVRREFQFTSVPVRAQRTLEIGDPAYGAVRIVNTADVPVSFTLHINDRIFLANRETMLAEALSRPSGIRRDDDIARLWSYILYQTEHFSSLTAALWAHDPGVLINSIGFGMCDDRAMALTYLAEMIGIPARIWDLEGHVVPEFFVAGRWEIWDPDYGVAYFDEAGNVASLADIETRPELITAPFTPMAQSPEAYSPVLEALYASVSDNRIVDYYYLHAVDEHDFAVSLPPDGRLTIGGQFGAPPATYLGVAAENFASAVLELPAGQTGKFISGLVPMAVLGTGTVRIGQSNYLDIGSQELGDALWYSQAFPGDVFVGASQTAVAISYLVNPVGARLSTTNSIVLEGLNAGALSVEMSGLSDSRQQSLYFPH